MFGKVTAKINDRDMLRMLFYGFKGNVLCRKVIGKYKEENSAEPAAMLKSANNQITNVLSFCYIFF